MGKRLSSLIKKSFEEAPLEEMEILTFGDLNPGESYISFPEPGDNHGHGGFKKGHYLFKKTKNTVYDGETYNARRKFDEQLSYFKDDFPVIKIL